MAEAPSSRLEQIAHRWTNDAFQTKPSSVPEIIYHYTDAAGLVGMLQNGQIWATDYRFLNDRSEIDHTRASTRALISSKLSHDLESPLKQFYERTAELLERGLPDDVFVFSFSEDSDDLSQWRGYARDGQGFTIGFSGRAICDATNLPENEYSFFRIEYDHKRQTTAIERAFAEIEKEFLRQAGSDGANLQALCDDAADWLVWVANNRSVANKHQSFKSEKEWRIMAAVRPDERVRDVRTRASGLRLVNYIELRLPGKDSETLPIVSIGVGPGFRGLEEAHAIGVLCEKAGYDFKPYYADTPYRRT